MHKNYKLEEKIIKDIIRKNLKCKDSDNEQLKNIFYNKNNKVSNLGIKNSLTIQTEDLNNTNVVYKYTCNRMTCQSASYIGMTLEKKLGSHYYNDSIFYTITP